MKQAARLADEHLALTRRHFLKLAASGVASLGAAPLFGAEEARHPELARLIGELEYLTPSEKFRNVERHRPLPYKLPPEKRLAVGLERESWQLEVIADPASNSQVKNPLSKERGTAFGFPELMKLAEQRAVRYLKVMTCNNLADPLGMGLWEGVPLRDVIWLAQPEQNVRRLFYHGYHNDDPKQLFQSSLPIGRVLEDPPGEQPVLLCYRLNGQWLTGERGGPVRMIVPEAYGFKSVKWLQRVLLTNNHQANDTYAEANNDVDSPMKSYARFLHWPKSAKAGQPIPLTGVAQAGMSGLRKVQYWLRAERDPLPAGDRYFTTAAWKDAEILPPPERWSSMLPDGKLPPVPAQFDEQGRPREWPLRYAIAHWEALLTDVPPGKYELRCRAIDANGVAQPMPRPFQKSGGNAIQSVSLTIHGR